MPTLIRGLLAGRSALQAFGTGLSAVAHNIANVSTPGYSPTRVTFTDVLAGGINQQTTIGSGTAATVTPPLDREALSLGSLELSSVDLTTELTNAILFRQGFQANARIIRQIDDLLQEITGF